MGKQRDALACSLVAIRRAEAGELAAPWVGVGLARIGTNPVQVT